MSHHQRFRSRILLTAVAAALLMTTLMSPASAATAPINDDGDFVHIYSANLENLHGFCQKGKNPRKGQWKELMDYMARGENVSSSPDIFVVEQINDKQLRTLLDYMNTHLSGPYAGQLAKIHPEEINKPDCKAKTHQGNAIIWRTSRFTMKDSKPWRSQSKQDGVCKNSGQDRTINQVIRFRDRTAHRYLSVSSIHWPTQGQKGWPCATNNIQRANKIVSGKRFGGDLRIITGDANVNELGEKGRTRPWYTAATKTLHYEDAIRDMCQAPDVVLRTCLDENRTFRAQRYDYLFAREAGPEQPPIVGARTISFQDADLADGHVTRTKYSEHRAITANVYYHFEVQNQ